MNMSAERKKRLENICHLRRIELIEMLYKFQTGHPGGSLSSVEIISVLYFEIMNTKRIINNEKNRDRFILSKGHSAPILYLTLADLGFFDESELNTFRQIDSILQGHPSAGKTPGVEISTGPLGLGLSAGVGISLSGKVDKKDFITYVLMGDGEIQEGIIWEAAMSAAKYKLENLIGIIDYNGVQLDGIMPLGDIVAKWKSFGWETFVVDGHDVEALYSAFTLAKEKKGAPKLIIAKTIKGKGISFMENKNEWHGKAIDKDSYMAAIEELEVANG